MNIPVTSYRVCRNCDRLIADYEDGNYHKPHACFTLTYLAGYVLGAMPSHLESAMKLALQPLGLEDDETFAIGYRAGMAQNELLGIDQMSTSSQELSRLRYEASCDGYLQGLAQYRKPVDNCHCGSGDCAAPKFDYPGDLYLQPCHCEANDCLEVVYVEENSPHPDLAYDGHIFGHVFGSRHLQQRTAFWWEQPDDEAENR